MDNEDLTWRFELHLPGRDGWVPITADLVGDELGACVGTQEMPCIWTDADEAAPDALRGALAELVAIGDPLRMTGARIVVWKGLGAAGEPACVLEATAAELAAGRLELATLQVQSALHEVEKTRTQVRAEIIRAATENRLSRNTIARLTSGALTRRLVLQLLAGYDLVEGIRDALSLWGDRYRRWYPPDLVTEPEDQEFLGPFCYGPMQLDLDPSGQVALSLIDIDGPTDPDLLPEDEYDEDTKRAYLQTRAERARGYAEEVLPALTRAGFNPRKPDGTTASLDDLAQTITGPGLSISDG